MRHFSLARSPEEPQFGLALLKLVIELRLDRKASLRDAMARALHGMRVDREAFHRHVLANRDHYLAVEEVVDVVRYLIRLGDNVKLGPQILLRTMRNPMAT